MFLIFCLSFALAMVFFGEEGVYVRKELLAERNYTQRLLEDKEAQVALLRERSGAEREEGVYQKDLIHSFGEGAVYEPTLMEVRTTGKNPFQGFDIFHCFLLALVPTGIFAAINIFLWILKDIRLSGQEAKEEKKKETHYGRYDD